MKNTVDFFYSSLENHKAILHKICNSYSKNNEDRSDLFQEIIIQIWHSIERYDPKYKMSTWIYRISLNTAISFYRKHKNRDKESTIQFDDLFSIDDSLDIEKDPIIEQLHEYIEALNGMNKALILLYLDDYNYHTISEILGISVSNVGTKIARIKSTLKDSLIWHI